MSVAIRLLPERTTRRLARRLGLALLRWAERGPADPVRQHGLDDRRRLAVERARRDYWRLGGR